MLTGVGVSMVIGGVSAGIFSAARESLIKKRKKTIDKDLYEYLSAQGKKLLDERTDILASLEIHSPDGKDPNSSALNHVKKRAEILEILITEYNQRIDLLDSTDKIRDRLLPIASVHELRHGDIISFGTHGGEPLEMEILKSADGSVELIPK